MSKRFPRMDRCCQCGKGRGACTCIAHDVPGNGTLPTITLYLCGARFVRLADGAEVTCDLVVHGEEIAHAWGTR